MRVKNMDEWQAQMAEFAADPNPMALEFQQFVLTWARLAEELCQANYEVVDGDLMDEIVNRLTPVEALRQTLRAAEEETSRWGVGFLGQALLILNTHWTPAGEGDAFYLSLNPIEQNLFLDVAAAWLIDKNAKAEEAAHD